MVSVWKKLELGLTLSCVELFVNTCYLRSILQAFERIAFVKLKVYKSFDNVENQIRSQYNTVFPLRKHDNKNMYGLYFELIPYKLEYLVKDLAFEEILDIHILIHNVDAV